MKKLIPSLIVLLGLNGCSGFYFNKDVNYINHEKEFKKAVISLQGKGTYRDNKGNIIDIPYEESVFSVPDKVLGKGWEKRKLNEKDMEKVMEAEKANLDNYFLKISTK